MSCEFSISLFVGVMSFESIEKLNREFERGYNNGQVKEAVSTYTNDARLFSTDKQIYEGLNQIEKYYSNSRAAGNTKVELHTGQVIQCGTDHLVEIRSLLLLSLFWESSTLSMF